MANVRSMIQNVNVQKENMRTSKSSMRSPQSDQLYEKVPFQFKSGIRESRRPRNIKLSHFYNDLKRTIQNTDPCEICEMTLNTPASIGDCGHMFCQSCLINYIIYKINAMEEILCPHQNCAVKLEIKSSIFKKIPQNLQQKYKKQELWQQTMKNPDIKLCPSQLCEQGTINLRLQPLQCLKCKTVFCTQCMMKEHKGMPCDQNFKMNFREWKRCPTCAIFIEKNQGCNHMICRCKHQFCFVCLQNWNTNHYSCRESLDEDLVNATSSQCPKCLAILMVIGFPFLLLFIAVVLLVSIPFCFVGGIVAGFIGSMYFISSIPQYCRIFIILALPIIVVGAGIGISVWGPYSIFKYLKPEIDRYLRTIKNLWNRN